MGWRRNVFLSPDLKVTCCQDDLNPRPLMARERLA